MTPFDGNYANSYALPLAASAYDSTQPPQGYAQSWEILAAASASIAPANAVPGKTTALQAMLKQPRKPLPVGQAGAPGQAAVAATPPNLHFGWVTADTATSTLVIAIRGSQYFSDWLHDFDFFAVPYKPNPGAGLVHNGFQEVYYAIRASILSVIAEAVEAYPALTNVLITGHSLGAAVVGLAAPDLISTSLVAFTTLVYTFAEPRVGLPAYADFFDGIVPVCYRVGNVWDIVPDLPPVVAGYQHEGLEVRIDSGFSLDLAHNHEIATGYVPGMAKWVHDHPTGVTMASVAGLHAAGKSVLESDLAASRALPPNDRNAPTAMVGIAH